MINPMGNPMMRMLFSGMQGNADPMSVLGQLAGNNPQMNNFMNLIRGKSPSQLEQIARNLYKDRGIDIDQTARSMGLKL